MKTAISIPDQVYDSAEALAERLGQSRSQLYTMALNSYLAEHGSDDLTRKLDEVYETVDTNLDPGLTQLQQTILPRDKW
jgi:predicted transcriptional regulator